MEKTKKLFYVATLKGLFRAGEPAEIVGKAMVTFKRNCKPRLCFKVRFNDGAEDLIPVFAAGDSAKKNPLYKLVTETDVREGRIPRVA